MHQSQPLRLYPTGGHFAAKCGGHFKTENGGQLQTKALGSITNEKSGAIWTEYPTKMKQLDISKFAPGIYNIKVKLNNSSFTEKLVIIH